MENQIFELISKIHAKINNLLVINIGNNFDIPQLYLIQYS